MQVASALSKLGEYIHKVATTLLVNFFTISIVGYYTIYIITLNTKFSVPRVENLQSFLMDERNITSLRCMGKKTPAYTQVCVC